MRTWLIHFWEYLRNSYWLIPVIMLVTAIALSYGLLEADTRINLSRLDGFGWLVFTSSDGALAVLSTIAASTFAAATLTFSVTMVTLSLTSSQFGPRLLRNFLRDPVNQFVFGAFIATFVYCLLIMRGMVVADKQIPSISISLALVFVLSDSIIFIGFIHHLTWSIRIERIAFEIGQEFIEAIHRFLPQPYAENERPSRVPSLPKDTATVIRSEAFGYVQAINDSTLLALAENEEITIELLFKPGHYVLPGAPIANIWPYVHLKDHITSSVRASFLLGKEPSGEQDLEFTIRQLVQIAARALSPGINDPFTAMTCIDYLAAGLAVIATRQLPEFQIRNETGRLLLVKSQISFQSLLEACFIGIRQMCSNNPPVVIYLLETFAQLASLTQRKADREALARIARLTFDSTRDQGLLDYDEQAIKQRLERIQQILKLSEKTTS
ncbi:DUF2254 domain-containing protein [Methylomonas sp.]|uniref:DUF2254 domain-containing protein n=1 Tax=Methylomonas sp. TaxID=418 RepID=UPI0025D01C9A|nr:DUF2254 domain-containing protein [Methylomonas sp.]